VRRHPPFRRGHHRENELRRAGYRVRVRPTGTLNLDLGPTTLTPHSSTLVLPFQVLADAVGRLARLGKNHGKGVPDVDHVVPHFELDLDAGGAGGVGKTRRVVEEGFRVFARRIRDVATSCGRL